MELLPCEVGALHVRSTYTSLLTACRFVGADGGAPAAWTLNEGSNIAIIVSMQSKQASDLVLEFMPFTELPFMG
jgi:hypothetical protein